MSRLKEQYQNEIIDAMIKKFGYKNIMEVPKLDKVVINMGVGEAKDNAKALDSAVADMEKITGQKAVLTRAKNSVANFKIRNSSISRTFDHHRSTYYRLSFIINHHALYATTYLLYDGYLFRCGRNGRLFRKNNILIQDFIGRICSGEKLL